LSEVIAAAGWAKAVSGIASTIAMVIKDLQALADYEPIIMPWAREVVG